MNLYFTLGVLSAYTAYLCDIGIEESHLKLTKAGKFLTLMLSVAFLMVTWPLLWVKIIMSVVAAVEVDDFKEFNAYMQSTNQDWDSISDLREISKRYYITKKEPILETDADKDLWNASKDS